MTSCIVGKKIRAMEPGPLELFSFVVLAILMAMAGGISEHMLTSWSSISTSWVYAINGHCSVFLFFFLFLFFSSPELRMSYCDHFSSVRASVRASVY